MPEGEGPYLNKRHEVLTLHEHLCSPLDFSGVRGAHRVPMFTSGF
jgi:hypothetical protein